MKILNKTFQSTKNLVKYGARICSYKKIILINLTLQYKQTVIFSLNSDCTVCSSYLVIPIHLQNKGSHCFILYHDFLITN